MASHPSPTRPGKRLRFRLHVLVAAAVAGLLCVCGLAQTVAGLYEAHGDAALEAAPAQDAAAGIAAFADAERWWSDPRHRFSQGLLTMRLALGAPGGQFDRARLEAASALFEQSLAEAPAEAKVWATLADARLIAGGPSPSAADALAMSIELARYEPTLLAMRCEMAIRMYALLDATRRAALDEQIQMLARHSAGDLVRVVRSTQRLDLVIKALEGDNAALNEFQHALRYVR
jgi:hypothetical protein